MKLRHPLGLGVGRHAAGLCVASHAGLWYAMGVIVAQPFEPPVTPRGCSLIAN